MRTRKEFRAFARLGLLGLLATAVAAGAGTDGSGRAMAEPYPEIGPLPEREAPKESLVAMGRRLFFDARISGDGAVSCATCHDPRKGFGDGLALSKAYPGTKYFRNSPTLLNTVHKADFPDVGWAWDGRMGANLNDVMRNEITETTIMNMDMRIMHERMKQDPIYVEMCEENFGGDCSSGKARKARKALVAFLSTLVSKDAPFDTGDISGQAERGRALFEGKAGCIQCHNGPYFSDGKPHNTGVPENLEIFTDPVRHLTYRAVIHTHGVPKMGIWRRDVGYFLVSKNYADVGKFVTPTLRELKYTAPFMHNGVFATLAEVAGFYNQGGGHDDPLATELRPLGLNPSEIGDLIAFLESLSSATPVTVERVDIPKKYQPIDDWLEVEN